MRSLNHVAMLGLVSILTLGSVLIAPISQSAIANPAQSQAIGTFVGVDHPTQGNARIVTKEGKNYLVLNDAFKSDDGPDLFVLLHRAQVPQSYAKQDYVSLGRLQKAKGKQWYEIPAGVDPSAYKSAVIWCRQFDVTFGYAPFKS